MTKLFKTLIGFVILFCVYLYINFLLQAKLNIEKTFVVESGENIVTVAKKLEGEKLIRSESLFKLLYLYKNKNSSLISYGEYDFKGKPYNLLDVVNKFKSGPDRSGVTITIPEGFTNEEIADRLEELLKINKNEFVEYARDMQGKLFPETYTFVEGAKKEEVVKKMSEEFTARVGDISTQDLTLASIVEGEAQHKEDMAMVAGILKNRIRIGMPLQVDVATDTYKTKDLPKLPINNPGLDSISAVRNPTQTDYMYYITGNDSNMYYAKTFKEHRRNIEKYLK